MSLGFRRAARHLLSAQEVIMIVAIPMIVGLMWNKWAGAAPLASCWAPYTPSGMACSVPWQSIGYTTLAYSGYLLSAMLIGHMSGALNQKSIKLKTSVLRILSLRLQEAYSCSHLPTIHSSLRFRLLRILVTMCHAQTRVRHRRSLICKFIMRHTADAMKLPPGSEGIP